MTQARLPEVNKAIRETISAHVELVRGDGYHYFVYDNAQSYEDESIMVPYTGQMSKEQWLTAAREFAAKHEPKEVESEMELGSMTLRTLKGVAMPTHQRIVERLRDQLLEKHNRFKSADHSPDVLKKFEVCHHEGSTTTFLTIDIGMENDEGTLASVFCRDYRHIAIGKKGGVRLLNSKVKSKSEGWWNVLHQLTR